MIHLAITIHEYLTIKSETELVLVLIDWASLFSFEGNETQHIETMTSGNIWNACLPLYFSLLWCAIIPSGSLYRTTNIVSNILLTKIMLLTYKVRNLLLRIYKTSITQWEFLVPIKTLQAPKVCILFLESL